MEKGGEGGGRSRVESVARVEKGEGEWDGWRGCRMRKGGERGKGGGAREGCRERSPWWQL